MTKLQKEELLFGLLMTIGMVTIMTSYNIVIVFGFNANALKHILAGIVPVFIVAFIVEQLIINHNVQKMHKLIVSPDDPKFKQIVMFSILMVTGMCLSMTLYATLVNVGTSSHFWQQYFAAVARNYPVALLSQLLVVGPLARALHAKIGKVRRDMNQKQRVELAHSTATN